MKWLWKGSERAGKASWGITTALNDGGLCKQGAAMCHLVGMEWREKGQGIVLQGDGRFDSRVTQAATKKYRQVKEQIIVRFSLLALMGIIEAPEPGIHLLPPVPNFIAS